MLSMPRLHWIEYEHASYACPGPHLGSLLDLIFISR